MVSPTIWVDDVSVDSAGSMVGMSPGPMFRRRVLGPVRGHGGDLDDLLNFLDHLDHLGLDDLLTSFSTT